MLKSILKSFSYLFSVQILAKVIAFFYNIFLAKSLGVSNFGLYSVALTYFSLLSTIGDLGIARYLMLSLAKHTVTPGRILLNTMIFRLISTGVLLIIMALLLGQLDPNHYQVSLSLLAISAIIPQLIALNFDAYFVAKQQLKFSALGLLILTISNAILGIWLVSHGLGAVGAVVAVAISQIIYMIFLGIIISKQVEFKSSLNFNLNSMVKELIKNSLPLGSLSLLGLLYFRVDTLILSYLKGPFDTGLYAAAYKFLEAIVFVPSALSAAFFPILADLADRNPRKQYQIYHKSLGINLLLSLPIVLGYNLILPTIIKLFLPQYLSSIIVIKILSLTIPFLFMISSQSLILLTHSQHLRALIVISIFNLIINIGLNFIFIPYYSYLASAVITVVSDILGFIIFYLFIALQFNQKTKLNYEY